MCTATSRAITKKMFKLKKIKTAPKKRSFIQEALAPELGMNVDTGKQNESCGNERDSTFYRGEKPVKTRLSLNTHNTTALAH